MPRRRSRHRNGAEHEVELDGSVTLYGIEDWTQVRDDPVLRIEERRAAREIAPDQVTDEHSPPEQDDF